MTVQAMHEAGPEPGQQLREAIIRRCALSDAAVADIDQLQDSLSLDFAAAAIRLRYVTHDDVESAAGSAFAPAIREPLARPSEALVIARSPYHPRSEQIRMLRTELMLRHEATARANVMAVLSPCASEGRSQLAAELAIAFSQLGRPTLLVDADLRRPQQHLLFNASNTHGLTQALEQQTRPRIQPVEGLPALFLLTAGPLPANPLELLSDRHFENLIAEWQRAFQFIVLDTPPVGRYADGLAVATIVGRVLSLSRARHTPYKDTRDMLRRLAATQSRILGAVINTF